MAHPKDSHTGPTVSGVEQPSLFGESQHDPTPAPAAPGLPRRDRSDVVAQLFHDVINRPVRGSTRVARVERLMELVDWFSTQPAEQAIPRTTVAQTTGFPYADLGVDLAILSRAHILHSSRRGYWLGCRLVLDDIDRARPPRPRPRGRG